MRDHKRKLRLLTLAAIAVLAAGALIARWKTPAERAAVPILQKNAEARGGLAAWRKVRTLTMEGTLDAGTPRDPAKQAAAYLQAWRQTKAEARRRAIEGAGGGEKPVQLPFVMELERPRKSRVELTFRGERAVQVYDGSSGWKLRPFLGRREVEPFTAEEARVAAQQADLDGPLIDADRKGSRVELLGTEPVEGRDAYKLHVTLPSGDVRNVWVDAQTFLEVRIDGSRRMDGKPRPVFTYFRDYRAVDGLVIPHELETAVEGVRGSEKIRIEHVAVNPPLDESRFGRPDAAGA
ncbi:MAG TPA: hypothetical protein VFM53_15290 [Anaeromyxobacteraceae bacterium]|nr:hypothetical protein [Anaeromyxobacteraceae bacterium]